MIHLQRTTSKNPDFQKLVKELDADLENRDGSEHPFFAQFNKIENIRYVVVVYDGDKPIGCGSIKEHSEKIMEIKRMFVLREKRGQGIASLILRELEKWCGELNYEKCILETGERQPEAIRLYKKNNYKIIPNFGQYANVESSVCFEKNLKA